MSEYNYNSFEPDLYDLASFDGPGAGEPFPGFDHLTDIAGDPVDLNTFRGRTLVIETGSVTCPMYAKGVKSMNQLALEHPDATFVVLYVREAHPGERIGPHESSAQKRTRATQLKNRFGDHRTVLLDDLEGTAHRQLGLLPNMVYVVDKGGVVTFRGDWNQSDVVASVINGSADNGQLSQEHYPPAKPRPDVAIRTLLNGGWRALFEFVSGLPGLMRLHAKADERYEQSASTDG